MVTFVAFIIAIVSTGIIGYTLGNRRTTGRDTAADGDTAAVEQRIRDVEQRAQESVRAGNEAAQKIQDIVHDIRNSSRNGDGNTGDKGGK